MTRIPLRWAVGDRCAIRGEIIGTIVAIYDDVATVDVGGRLVPVVIDDLYLVPFSHHGETNEHP